MTTAIRTCPACGVRKVRTEFHVREQGALGLQNCCKTCTRKERVAREQPTQRQSKGDKTRLHTCIPAELHAALTDMASERGVSMSKLIVGMLETGVRARQGR